VVDDVDCSVVEEEEKKSQILPIETIGYRQLKKDKSKANAENLLNKDTGKLGSNYMWKNKGHKGFKSKKRRGATVKFLVFLGNRVGDVAVDRLGLVFSARSLLQVVRR